MDQDRLHGEMVTWSDQDREVVAACEGLVGLLSFILYIC